MNRKGRATSVRRMLHAVEETLAEYQARQPTDPIHVAVLRRLQARLSEELQRMQPDRDVR